MIDRGKIGTAPAPTERDDECYLDFVEGGKHVMAMVIQPAMRSAATAALRDAGNAGSNLEDLDTILQVVDALPIVKATNRLQRSFQEMMWRATDETLRKREAELIAGLDRADRMGPGSVEYDPNFSYPDYYDPHDFHVQSGSYHRDPLAGYVYHLGTKYFLQGSNDNDELQRTLVASVPPPADGRVSRILDLACSVGQSTTAFKERFPGAEVWGVDVSEPMVRYAHKRAVEMGCDVRFKQALAEDSGFPDNHFDLVFANIMFHELPMAVSARAIVEVCRILRPGGVFVFVDLKDRSHLKPDELPYIRYYHDWQAKYQGEPYHPVFHETDFTALMRDAGFRDIDNDFRTADWHPGLVMPMRVGIK